MPSSAVASALEGLGFEVTARSDLGVKEFRKTLAEFAKSASGSDSVVFYFSGRAFQYGEQNYLMPVDARLASREAIEKEALRLPDILAKLQGRKRQTFVFLDMPVMQQPCLHRCG